MIGITIIVLIAFIFVIFCFMMLIVEFIDSLKGVSWGKTEIFMLMILIILIIGAILACFGI